MMSAGIQRGQQQRAIDWAIKAQPLHAFAAHFHLHPRRFVVNRDADLPTTRGWFDHPRMGDESSGQQRLIDDTG